MKEIKQRKERRFLKTLGRVGEILVEQVLIKLGSNIIKKIGGKKTLPSILFLCTSISLFAQYPATGNKQRLGFQTTGDGLTWRGSISDTASIQPINNQSAWVILDTINLKFYTFDFTSNVWNLVGGGGSAFTQPVDSLFFNVGVPTNNVDTAKMRWDSDLATVVLGLNDNVPNELGFKNFWLVKNQTGSTITKGSLVYANGTVGSSGRITVAKFIANGSIDAKYLLGITAHDLTDGEDGYVISFGKIRQVNTDTFAAGAILYPSPTVAGVWTDVEPIAPNIDMPIGFCINSSVNNGTIAIRVASGYKLSELHDVSITSPLEKASLYYSGGLWRDTTAALLVSDTASMLANYATKAYADTTGRLYARQDFTNVSSSTLTWAQSDTLIPGGVNVVQVYRNGQILLPSQYTIPTSTSVVIAASSFKVNDNYTVIFPRGGGAGSGGGSGSLTSISGGTGIIVSPNPITTTGTVSADLSVLMELTDTSLLNLTSRFNTKLNISDTTAMLSNYNTRINSKLNISDTLSMLAPYFRDADTTSLNLTSRFALKLNAADTASLSNRIDAKGNGTVTSVATGYGLSGGTITSTGTLLLDSAVVFSRIRDSIVDVAIGNDTIKILKQEYAPATTSVLTWTITSKFPIQSKSFILVFRNGQLLINDQYNLTDTNKITIVSNSFKVGSNYTVVTVSGIGSVGTGVFPNPVYPEAGIAVSTGTSWTTSIPNNSTNWNIAFNDKINNAAFSGTTTKTLTLTQYDGGTLTAPFTDLQGIVAADTASMLTNYLRTGVAASTYQTKLTNPVTGTGTVNYIPKFTSINEISDANLFTNGNRFVQNEGSDQSFGWDKMTNTSSPFFGNNVKAGSGDERIQRTASTTLFNPSAIIFGFQRVNNSSGATSYGGINFMTTSGNPSGDINPIDSSRMFIEPTGNIGIGTMEPSFKFDIRGTLGVTGEATLLNKTFVGNFTDNTPTSGGNHNIRLESNDVSSIGFHDDGNTIANIRFSAATGFVIGGSDGTYGPHSTTIAGSTTLSAPLTVNSSSVFNEGSTDSDFRVESDGNANMLFVDASTDRVGIGTNAPTRTLEVNGTVGVSSNVTANSFIKSGGSFTQFLKADGTVDGNDYLTTSSAGSTYYPKTGGTISGAVTLSTTTATPTSLLGKDGSNVVGTVTTVAQTGLMKAGSTTTNTSSVGIITVPHGLSYTPSQVLVTLAQQNSYIIVCHSITSSNMLFTVYDSITGNVLNNVSVGFFWLAIK